MGAPRSLIDIFQLGEQEVFYASVLAWLLDPSETHGLQRGLAARLAEFARTIQPGLAAPLQGGQLLIEVAHPGPLPQICITAGPARLALIVTTHGPPSAADRPPPGTIPLALGWDEQFSNNLPTWTLGQVYLWLGEVQPQPRWRHFLQTFRAHLHQALQARGITPTKPSAPPPLVSSPGPAPAYTPPAAPAMDLSGGWAGGGFADSDGYAGGGPADSGYAGGFASPTPAAAAGPSFGSGGLADQWEMQEIEEAAAEPQPSPEPDREEPSPAHTGVDGLNLDARAVRERPEVQFAGSQTLLDAAAASMFPGGVEDGSHAERAAKTSPLASSSIRLLTELQKGIGFFRLYPREHPFCMQVVDHTHALFVDHHEQFGALSVRLQREGIYLEDLLVMPETTALNSISWLLYPEGIRSLSFERGITSQEVHDFIDALSPQEETEISIGNDLLSALWRRDFVHIQYLTYDQLSPAGLRNVHDPSVALLAKRIQSIVGVTGADGADDSDLTDSLTSLPPISTRDPQSWSALPEKAEEYCESPAGQGRQRLRAKLLDSFLGDTLGRSADLVSWANTHEAYKPVVSDEANFMTGMVLNALWQGNLDGALDLVARAAGGGQLDASKELVRRLGSEQCLTMLSRCLLEHKTRHGPSDLLHKGIRYLSRLGPDAARAIARTCGLQVDPDVRNVLLQHLKSRPQESMEAIVRLTTHANQDISSEAMHLLAEIPGGRRTLEGFTSDEREPERAKRAHNLLGRVTGTFDRQKHLRIVASYPIKKNRLASLEKIRTDKSSEALAAMVRVVEDKSFAKRDADEIDATLGALVEMGGVRILRVLQGLTERKTMVFGKKDTAKLITISRKWMSQLKGRKA